MNILKQKGMEKECIMHAREKYVFLEVMCALSVFVVIYLCIFYFYILYIA